MHALLLVAAIVSQRNLMAPDDLSTFRSTAIGGGSDLNVIRPQLAVLLAHRLWRKSNFPEDWIDKNTENGFSCDPRAIAVVYRSRIFLAYTATTGKLYAVTIARPTKDVSPNLTLEQCVAKVREWYQEVGGHYPLVFGRAEFEQGVAPEQRQQFYHIFMNYTAANSAYKFASGVEAIVERTYGTPEGMWMGERPPYDPPQHVVTKETAVANALASAFEHTGWAQMEGASQDAMFTVPAYAHLPNRLGQAHRDRLAQGRAGLIYEVTVRDGSFVHSEERPQPFVQVYVDAETGEPIAVLPAYRFQGARQADARKFAWGTEKWTLGRSSGTIMPASDARVSDRPNRVLLRQGRRALVVGATRDAKRIWLTAGGKVQIGKPDESLRRAILSASPLPSFPMRKPEPSKTASSARG